MKLKQNRFYWISCMIFSLLCIFQFASVSIAATLNPYGIESDNPYVVNRFIHDGELIDEVIVPGRPPESYRALQTIIPESNAAAGTNTLSNVPAFDWSYGCSATSAAMMFGYYDNSGYPNIYTGPTNGGIIPMTNAVWGAGECPLSATHLGIDGRTIKGHVDDYWIAYGSNDPDPFIGNWTEHTQGECTGDFMGTNQSLKSSSDGSTTFYFNTRGSPLYDYRGAEPDRRDGCHGMRLFFESRGYKVSSNYSQYIMGYNGNTQGFTFANYKQEIDAGRPVMIQVDGHTMLGYGYNDSGKLVYLRDTWDYNSHSMTWGRSYEGMQHYGVTVFVPKVTMVSPNGRERLPSGGSWTLVWGGPPKVTSYKLFYSLNNGLTWKPIATETGTSMSWTLPTVSKNATTCRTKVEAYNGAKKVGADESDKPFTIEVMKVDTPTDQETCYSGRSCPIAWTTHATKNPPVATFTLSYTTNNGLTWKPIPHSLTGNPGIFEWNPPPFPNLKTKCKVKVVLKDGSGNMVGSDTSDGVFTISP